MNVLIVDDEDTILKGLAALISELPEAAAGGEIYGALNGAEALDILSSRPVDLVITDIHMPGIDGLSLTGTIRYRHPEIPVVLLTGYNDSSYMQQAIRLKAEDYLFKPVKKEDLASMFRRIDLRKTTDRKRDRFVREDQFDALAYPAKRIVACDLDEGGGERRSQLGNDEMILWMYRKVIYEAADAIEDLYFIPASSPLDGFNMLIGAGAETPEAAGGKLDTLAAAVRAFWSDSIKLQISFGLSAAGGTAPFRALEREACSALSDRLFQRSGIYRFASMAAPPLSVQAKTSLQSAIEVGDADTVLSALKAELLRFFEGNAASPIPAAEGLIQFLYAQLAKSYPSASTPLQPDSEAGRKTVMVKDKRAIPSAAPDRNERMARNRSPRASRIRHRGACQVVHSRPICGSAQHRRRRGGRLCQPESSQPLVPGSHECDVSGIFNERSRRGGQEAAGRSQSQNLRYCGASRLQRLEAFQPYI